MQRGWSSFADRRHITFSKTIGEDQRLRHFLTVVCLRRWPPSPRPQASQRPSDLRISATVIFLTRVDAGLEMQRRRSPAKPDGLGGDEGILASESCNRSGRLYACPQRGCGAIKRT